jgi:hypothetical protein
MRQWSVSGLRFRAAKTRGGRFLAARLGAAAPSLLSIKNAVSRRLNSSHLDIASWNSSLLFG